MIYLSSTGLYLISKNKNMVPDLDKVLDDMVSFCMAMGTNLEVTAECLARMASEKASSLSSNYEKFFDDSEDSEHFFMDCA